MGKKKDYLGRVCNSGINLYLAGWFSWIGSWNQNKNPSSEARRLLNQAFDDIEDLKKVAHKGYVYYETHIFEKIEQDRKVLKQIRSLVNAILKSEEDSPKTRSPVRVKRPNENKNPSSKKCA